MVRASLAELEIIAQAMEAMNETPPQINIKAKFIEITQVDNRALGFDWFLGGVNMAGGNIVGQGGTQPSLTGNGSAVNPGGISSPAAPVAGAASGTVR